MSSMRNAIQRRNHKERAQPLGREKWGLLEKRKDYTLRAKDHNEKRKRLKILREKAAFANPDEFSFKMMSSRTKDGQRIGDRGNTALPHSVVQLLKTQDAGYIRTMLQKTRKERERLEQEIQIEKQEGRVQALKGDTEEESRIIKFVRSREEQSALVHQSPVDSDDDDDGSHGNKDDKVVLLQERKPSRRDLEALRLAEVAEGRVRKRRQRDQEARRNLLQAVRERENDLILAEQELDLQRAKMSNAIGGVNKTGVKFKIRERKR